MPRCATSNLPALRPTAPVKAPFSYPNSSVSRRFSGIAAQLIATNGPDALGLSACSARATSSLPVPLSPSTSTVVSPDAARWTARHHALQRVVLADDVRQAAPCGQLLAEQQVLGGETPLLERASDEHQQVLGIDGLREEVERPLAHGAHRVLDAAEGGHHDDRHVRVGVLGLSQHAETVTDGQPQVGEHERGTAPCEECAGLGGVAGLGHHVARGLEGEAQHAPKRVLVFDEEDFRSSGRHRAQRLRGDDRQR